jgi:Rrf2 family protein
MAANSQFSMAVHVLTLLARADGANLKSDAIARSVNTNPVVIRRLIGQLGHSGLVVSQSGSTGGTRLAIPPDKVKLSDIYRSVCCGDVFALHDSPSPDCPVGRGIESVLCNIQKRIDRSIGDTLATLTLRDITRMVEEAS